MDELLYFFHRLVCYFKKWSIRRLLKRFLLEQITVETSGGTVAGTLIGVGSDYIELLEATGDRVLVPLESLDSFA
ncbi:hypothetical protein ACHHV8_14925 [Paenibacillus sp. TAB 01]|uniref:hypothetical protein n=1 Tax=Paenibacillus sp. TAB 01 TaxID=3368988 RepID=UPI00375284F6